MDTNQLEVLARIVLPSEILDYFKITSVEQTLSEIHIHLDELMNPGLSRDVHFESKGFMDPVNESPMNRFAFPMETLVRNYLSEAVTFYLNQQTNGRKNKRKGLKSFLMNIQISKWHMGYHIH